MTDFKSPFTLLLAVAFVSLLTEAAMSSEFREVKPIPRAGFAGKVTEPVSRDLIIEAVELIYGQYNEADFRRLLADDFYDGERLADNIQRSVPRDARMRVLAVNDTRTLEQQHKGGQRISLVSAIVIAQLEYTGEDGSLVRLEGEHELHIRLFERVDVS